MAAVQGQFDAPPVFAPPVAQTAPQAPVDLRTTYPDDANANSSSAGSTSCSAEADG